MHNSSASATLDLDEFVDRLRLSSFETKHQTALLFERGAPIHIARAPGRLDVMGGIGDYSGCLVLELPIREATLVAVQSADEGLDIVSHFPEQREFRRCQLSDDDWRQLLKADYANICQYFGQRGDGTWTACVAGALLVLAKEGGRTLPNGMRVFVESAIPEAKGVSSSAALEVATMRAAIDLMGDSLDGARLAELCQFAENRVVGAACGIMDQMTSALGRANQLLALCCQPATVEGFVPIPASIGLWGIDSGIRHTVTGCDYTRVRTGAFMGYRMIAEMARFEVVPESATGKVRVDDSRWQGYLANLSPAEFHAEFRDRLPLEIRGREFIGRYQGISDSVTDICPDETYPIRFPTSHPIEENQRVHEFRRLLMAKPERHSLVAMGKLMYAAHHSYSECGLGSDGTDLLVELARQAGPDRGVFGAKITGGGSGGTVAVLACADAHEAVRGIAKQYERETNRQAYLFFGSSPGACEVPPRRVILN